MFYVTHQDKFTEKKYLKTITYINIYKWSIIMHKKKATMRKTQSIRAKSISAKNNSFL